MKQINLVDILTVTFIMYSRSNLAEEIQISLLIQLCGSCCTKYLSELYQETQTKAAVMDTEKLFSASKSVLTKTTLLKSQVWRLNRVLPAWNSMKIQAVYTEIYQVIYW